MDSQGRPGPDNRVTDMKRILLAATALLAWAAAPASAADLAPKMVTKAPQAIWDWTGFYVGGYVGVGTNRSHAFDPTAGASGELDFVGTGFTGGGVAGYNWQVSRNWVVGIEGDIGYLGLSHNSLDYNEGAAQLFTNQETNWLATLRGRVGYTTGPNLTYVTGGAAWVHTKDSLVSTAGAVSSSETKTGWVYGSGTETMLGGGWTAKAETLYVNAGDSTLSNGTFGTQTEHRYAMQRFGVNYLFGAKPQPALPQYNWSGAYAGIIGGSANTQIKLTDPTGILPGEFGNNGSGFHVGGNVGYNWQISPMWVVGVEGDFSYFGLNHSVDNYNDSLALYTVVTHWIATARARVGYSTGPALLYVTGGGAWVNVNEHWNWGSGEVAADKTLSGYTIGGGIETVLWNGWTSKNEYLFVDVGNGSVLNAPPGVRVQGDHEYHLFRTSLTYKFGG